MTHSMKTETDQTLHRVSRLLPVRTLGQMRHRRRLAHVRFHCQMILLKGSKLQILLTRLHPCRKRKEDDFAETSTGSKYQRLRYPDTNSDVYLTHWVDYNPSTSLGDVSLMARKIVHMESNLSCGML